jgi:hypothetical protein
MKFAVLALDYDGTIAQDGKVHPAVVEAVGEARSRGISVVLVTGRILSDLRRVLGNQELFDAIVAENGAVLAFPRGWTRVLGHPLPESLLSELRRLNVAFASGECILEADALDSSKILDAVRTIEPAVGIVFNLRRIMLLPLGISKATGLREALTTMRLSVHNCIAMGSGENDYQLLEACEIGVAVGSGASSLREIADEVLSGTGPAVVADYIRQVIQVTKLPPNRVDRRRVHLGFTAQGLPLETAVHGRNILIAGDMRSGKSWVTGLFCEQLILQGYCLCVIDPEGDYGTLESLPSVVVFGDNEPLPRLNDVARALRYPDISVVINLSQMPHTEKAAYVASLLPELATLRQCTGQPHWIVVDEAHYFLHELNATRQLDLDLAAYLLVTYRVSDLHPDLLKSVESIIVTQLTDPREVNTLRTMYGREGAESEWETLLGGLSIDEAALLPRVDDEQHRLQRFKVAKRVTSHVRHRTKYLEVPMRKKHGFVFTCNGRPIGDPVRTLKEFVTTLERVPLASLEGHARRGDFSRWIADVFGDHF